MVDSNVILQLTVVITSFAFRFAPKVCGQSEILSGHVPNDIIFSLITFLR